MGTGGLGHPRKITNCVKIFNVRHDAKRYRVSQGIIVSWKMYFFSIISFLNDSKFYDEE